MKVRYRYDYIRVKIACRDVTKVPKKAESTLGMYIFYFGFEREIPTTEEAKSVKNAVKINNDTQPIPKTFRANENLDKSKESKGSGNDDFDKGSSKQYGKQQVQWSAPSKIEVNPRGQTKLMADAQKGYKEDQIFDDGEKVHIPDTIEDSDSENEYYTTKIQKLTGFNAPDGGNEQGESSKQI